MKFRQPINITQKCMKNDLHWIEFCIVAEKHDFIYIGTFDFQNVLKRQARLDIVVALSNPCQSAFAVDKIIILIVVICLIHKVWTSEIYSQLPIR